LNKERNNTRYHPAFIKYQHFIAEHASYQGMPGAFGANGNIRWVAPKPTQLGQERLRWWEDKADELQIERTGPWISRTARTIHPLGEKPCQVCGEVMSLDYIYQGQSGRLGPGAMSNAPDRFDGFHSYNRCCRSTSDKGRHKSNLAKYGEDRRTYEYWVDGDWKAASWLMKVFSKHGLSPDHIGPLSLGFCHRPSFRPMSRAENSARNNRMTFNDIQMLQTEERAGEQVVSWHTKHIWTAVKGRVKNDSDALEASKLMRINLHFVLTALYELKGLGLIEYITHFLRPDYAMYSIAFEGFDQSTGKYLRMIKTPGTRTEHRRNADRYIRKSLAALDEYSSKKNRRLVGFSDVASAVQPIAEHAQNHDYQKADDAFHILLNRIASDLVEQSSL
jgi:hypothetical protein